jgi:outer membrane protein assembly factor BamB
MSYRFLVGLVLLLSLPASWAGADDDEFQPKAFDWPQWRGPQRNGVSKEKALLTEWPREGPPLKWKAPGLGGGYGGVAVAAGRVFGMGRQGEEEVVWALQESTGKLLWTALLPLNKEKTDRVLRNDGPRCTPTVDGERLYALGVYGDLVCLEVATGKEVWHQHLKREFGGELMSPPGWGYSESPLVDGDKLICTPGRNNAALVALDKKTGELVWRAEVSSTRGAGYSSIVVAEVGGVRHYIQSLSSGLVGIAAESGKRLWEYNDLANRVANVMTPLVKGDQVFCSAPYNKGSALLRLLPDGAGGIKHEVLKTVKGEQFQNYHGGLVLVDDHVYGGHGHNNGLPACFSLDKGDLAWRKDRGAGIGSAAVVCADGHIYFHYENGIMALVEATPSEYREKGKFELPYLSGKPGWSHPVVANGCLYVRDQDVLMCFDVKKR